MSYNIFTVHLAGYGKKKSVARLEETQAHLVCLCAKRMERPICWTIAGAASAENVIGKGNKNPGIKTEWPDKS